jgi:hypothetical protein
MSSMRARLEELFKTTPNHVTEITAEQAAVWEYVSGGPLRVTHWGDLPDAYKRLSRSELGLVAVPSDRVRLVCVSDEKEEEEEEDSSKSSQ